MIDGKITDYIEQRMGKVKIGGTIQQNSKLRLT